MRPPSECRRFVAGWPPIGVPSAGAQWPNRVVGAPLDSLDARYADRTEGAAPPVWSPDSRHLAFGAGGVLKTIDVSGGPPRTLCGTPGDGVKVGGGTQGVILFGAGPSGLWQVAARGGTPMQVTTVDRFEGEYQHSGPTFLPDGRRFLYHVSHLCRKTTEFTLGRWIQSLRKDHRPAHGRRSEPIYAPSPFGRGSLFFLRGAHSWFSRLTAQSELTGNPITIAEDVGSTGYTGMVLASATGALAFRTGRDAVSKK